MIVAVRIKPLELEERDFSIESISPDTLTVTTPEATNTFKFDYVHWSTGTVRDYPHYISQDTVFNEIGKPLVENATKGYNCSLFAYGQTVRG